MKLLTYNSFFDCNYSTLMIQILDRGVVITFKNKLIYGNDVKPIAMVQIGCYSLSMQTVRLHRQSIETTNQTEKHYEQ